MPLARQCGNAALKMVHWQDGGYKQSGHAAEQYIRQATKQAKKER
jgi:hypothetical protein